MRNDAVDLTQEHQDIDEIKLLYVEMGDLAKDACHKAIRIGELLIGLKKAHEGHWTQWLEENNLFSSSYAYKCIGIYRSSLVRTRDQLQLEWTRLQGNEKRGIRRAKLRAQKAQRDLEQETKHGITEDRLGARCSRLWDLVTKDEGERAKKLIAKTMISFLFSEYPELKDEPF